MAKNQERSRLEREVLESSAFVPLWQRHREAFSHRAAGKVVPLAGDVSQEGLGLDPGLRDLVAGDCQLIVNSAASVSFDERLDRALELNTYGPARLLRLARAGRNIPLVQISTAYVCGERSGSMPEELGPGYAAGGASCSLPGAGGGRSRRGCAADDGARRPGMHPGTGLA